MKKKRLFAALAAALVAAAAAWLFSSGRVVPLWVRWNRVTLDIQPQIVVQNKRLTVFSENEAVWQTESPILVQDALFCDIDHDDAAELLILCWKKGRYGNHRPFWVTEDESGYSQHIFIYDWTGQTMKPIWMASDIGMDAVRWRFDETSRLAIWDRGGRLTHWDWLSWGLSNIDP